MVEHLHAVNEATQIIESQIMDIVAISPINERYSLLLFRKLLESGYDPDSLLVSCHRIVDCVIEYSMRNINSPSNFVGLQINKLLYVDNETLIAFISDISITNLKKIITEEKIIDIADHDLDNREFISGKCNICNGVEYEIIKNDIGNYCVCTSCWMPISQSYMIG